MSTAPDAFLTTGEVAAELCVARSTVLRWADEGKLQAVKLGPKTVRFRRSDVDRFTAAGAA